MKSVPDIVWVVTGKRIDQAEPYLSACIDGAIWIDTDSGPVYIKSGRWFKSQRGAKLAIKRRAAQLAEAKKRRERGTK